MSSHGNASCCFGDFEDSYKQSSLPIMRDIEEEVLGVRYGATSWMTLPQARRMQEDLRLQAGQHHVDIGSGSGWPGLFLAEESGCDITLVDLPLLALQQARQRACHDGMQSRCQAVLSDATALQMRFVNLRTVYERERKLWAREASAA